MYVCEIDREKDEKKRERIELKRKEEMKK